MRPSPPIPPETISWFWIQTWSVLPAWYQASTTEVKPATTNSAAITTGRRTLRPGALALSLLSPSPLSASSLTRLTLLLPSRSRVSRRRPLKPSWYLVTLKISATGPAYRAKSRGSIENTWPPSMSTAAMATPVRAPLPARTAITR